MPLRNNVTRLLDSRKIKGAGFDGADERETGGDGLKS